MAFKTNRYDEAPSDSVSHKTSTDGREVLPAAETLVGRGMKVVGEIDADENIIIQGSVTGQVRSGQALVIGIAGEVDGGIRAHTVIISGSVRGDVDAGHRLEILPGGRINGNIKTDILVVKEGAFLVGQVNTEETPVQPLPA